MPILSQHPARKYRCKSCGWKIVRPSFTAGDCITPAEGAAIRGVTECPKCGSKEIETGEPSVLEKMDPLAGKRWREFTERFTVRKGPGDR